MFLELAYNYSKSYDMLEEIKLRLYIWCKQRVTVIGQTKDHGENNNVY